MTVTTVSAREFARDFAGAKRQAEQGPVFITDRGKPVYALMKIDDYYQLTGGGQEKSLAELMASLPSTEGIEFEPARVSVEFTLPDYD